MPSRMAMLTGKVPEYTGVYRNMACKPFRDYTDNEIFVLPEYLKDSAGYFTYGAGKIAHCYDSYPEYDTITTDPCAKTLSWNKYIVFPGGEQPDVKAYGDSVTLGQGGLRWTPIPDTMETKMWDYQATDSLIAFINAVGSGADPACGKPLMLTIGYKKPHQTLYIPEKYFSPYYQDSWTSYPYRKPYNFPEGSSPYNGIVMPPQPL
jgi:arylsulfatase A-like enzyme